MQKITHLQLKRIRTYFVNERLGDNFIISAYWIYQWHQPVLFNFYQRIKIDFAVFQRDFHFDVSESWLWKEDGKFAFEN